VKKISSAWLVGATVALVAALFSASLPAQTQPAQPNLPQLAQLSQPQTAEALLALPEAPGPQNGAPAASASSSSSQAAPASTATPPVAAAPAAGSAPASTGARQQHDKAERELKLEEQQHLLGVVPNFNVVLNGQALPINGRQKWDLALHEAVNPFYFGWAFVIGGGYSELVDSNSGYGWGPSGYFKRVGANYADNVNGELIGNALLPQLLHQDPRYFRKGTGSIKGRIWVAALSTVECRGDNGKTQFNVSNVLGNYISGAISNAYYPASQRGVALTLENGSEVTLFGALGGQFYEFAPDIIRILFKRKPAATPVTTPSATPAAAPAVPAAGSSHH
jgi:hypothetical protein